MHKIYQIAAARGLTEYNPNDFAAMVYDTVTAFKSFYANAPTQADLMRSVQAQAKPHSGYLTDLFDVVFNSLCSIAAGASPLLGDVVAETVIYINLYVDLYKRAAIAGLQYSFSGRLAERELESFM